ncbi:hypothetical protein N5F23_23515 [Pseudomonas sichuanensis]|uniref:hypothetical protein n=1 Tax=Pseudomonas TaxID=286 RepID=UPI0015B43A90|nr:MULTISPECIES: hypothetical protein [Pseudomonas]MDH0734105.1 hypothetical protein [Pseudomonas sichuanensis]MDH1585564.1 hypothetical protein [Pseudomonas sichuanensis]MDH1594953.1 hypothetical protein [Pseudomonas sichuanensis]MDH1600257.1 hypothetical protein [Pseudomonas sichuanensis]MDU9403983.1 hypothetical protein [Pseudomonas sp. zfem004]
MVMLCRLSLLILVAGTLLGDIVVASVGLAALCAAAVYHNVQQDTPEEEPQEPGFTA